MILRLSVHRVARRAQRAFTLIEVMVAVAIIGLTFVSLYAGMAFGTSTIAQARENLRANQIITDRLEEMRIYGWDYLTNAGNVPANFVVPFYPTNTDLTVSDVTVGTVARDSTFSFYGSITITNTSLTNTYSEGIRMITVTLNWTNGSFRRDRIMSTYFSRNGMQSYLR